MGARKNRSMSVRRKIFIVMTGMSVLVLLAVYALSRIILEPGSNANEVLRVSDNNLRVRSAVEREIADLDRHTKDYASWDDTYRFIRDLNSAYIESNLIDTAQIDNEFDVMIYIDLSGRVLVSRAFDRTAGAARPVPPGLLELLAPGGPLLGRPNETGGRMGLVNLPQGAFLVSAHPILTSQGSGPARGTVLFARAFDATAVSKLGDVTHLPLRAVPLADPTVPAGFAAATRAETDDVRIRGADLISGFVLFKDIGDRPSLVLAYDLPRTFHTQFLNALRYFLIALLLYTGLNLILGQWLMDRMVSSRLIRLTGFMKTVEKTGALDSRLTLSGKDEVARLAAGLNTMLAALGRHVDAIKAAEDAVKRSEAKYRALFDAATDAIFLQTHDGRILDCNPTAARLFDRDKADLIGLVFSSLFDGHRASDQDRLREELSNRGFVFIERIGRKKGGEKFPCEVSVRGARIGRSDLIVAFVHDTTERARSEDQLRKSLREKEVLLREVHHRVKNNMQIISSLFNLQSESVRDPSAISLLRECQVRIRSMALVHEKLYQSKDMAHILFSDYLRSLAMYLFHFWQVNEDRIRLDMRIANILLDVNTAIPLGLIVNELISNALEHAFPDGRVGEIRVRLVSLDPSQFELIVEDDGVGLPPGFDIAGSETLGLQLVGLLVKQLDGTIEAETSGGTRYRIIVNALKYKQRF
jgi:PAS domain S-box-containing protein